MNCILFQKFCIWLHKESAGRSRRDESLFPELELWLHTWSSKVRTYLAWLNLGQIWQHLISQWADEGSLHDIRAAAGRRFRANQAGTTAVLGSAAGESWLALNAGQNLISMNKIYWGQFFSGKVRSEQHATSAGAEVCGGRQPAHQAGAVSCPHYLFVQNLLLKQIMTISTIFIKPIKQEQWVSLIAFLCRMWSATVCWNWLWSY